MTLSSYMFRIYKNQIQNMVSGRSADSKVLACFIFILIALFVCLFGVYRPTR